MGTQELGRAAVLMEEEVVYSSTVPSQGAWDSLMLMLHTELEADVPKLASAIDEHSTAIRTIVLSAITSNKEKLYTASKIAIEQERKVAASVVESKQQELDASRRDLAVSTACVLKYQQQQLRFADAYVAVKDDLQLFKLLVRAFYNWKQFAEAKRLKKAKQRKAEIWRQRKRLTGNVFRAWLREAYLGSRKKAAEELVQSVEAARLDAEQKATLQIQLLQSQVHELQIHLDRSREARSKLEEDMKQAFMRGVCALNMEALSIMKRGQVIMPPKPLGGVE